MKKNTLAIRLIIPALVLLLALVLLAACSSKTSTTTAAVIISTPAPVQTTTTSAPVTSSPAPVTSTTAPATSFTVMISSKPGLGNYLVDGKGMTLYYFTKDSRGTSTASAAVVAAWPIFTPASFVVGPGLLASDFSMIARSDATMQAAFKGWPLYYYAKDKAAGDTLGQAVNNVWYVIDPANFTPPVPTTTMPPMTTVTPTVTASPTPSATATAPAVTLNIAAQSLAFDKSTLTVQAGAAVTLIFNNQDNGVPHNVSVYQNLAGGQVKAVFVGDVINGPNTITYTFVAPAAGQTYYFVCDVHPFMTGAFVVTP